MARAINTATLPQSTVEDALRFIGENLRAADLKELGEAAEFPEEVLFESWELSTISWLILDRTGLPIGIMGAAPHMIPGLGIAWMMGTDGVEREALSIARQTRRYVEEMHEQYPVLWNYVDAENELSLRWLEWSGFHIVDADPNHGPEGRLFLEFTRTSG